MMKLEQEIAERTFRCRIQAVLEGGGTLQALSDAFEALPKRKQLYYLRKLYAIGDALCVPPNAEPDVQTILTSAERKTVLTGRRR